MGSKNRGAGFFDDGMSSGARFQFVCGADGSLTGYPLAHAYVDVHSTKIGGVMVKDDTALTAADYAAIRLLAKAAKTFIANPSAAIGVIAGIVVAAWGQDVGEAIGSMLEASLGEGEDENAAKAGFVAAVAALDSMIGGE